MALGEALIKLLEFKDGKPVARCYQILFRPLSQTSRINHCSFPVVLFMFVHLLSIDCQGSKGEKTLVWSLCVWWDLCYHSVLSP